MRIHGLFLCFAVFSACGTDPSRESADTGAISIPSSAPDEHGVLARAETSTLPLGDCQNNHDTDGDGVPDCVEIALGTDPLIRDAQLQGTGSKDFGCRVDSLSPEIAGLIVLAYVALRRRRWTGTG